jgi:hypothetical protein
MTYQEGFWSVTRRCLILFTLTILIGSWQPVYAVEQAVLLFQEIMPRPASGSPEYLTLYNPTDRTISLAGWLIADKAKQNKPISLPDYPLMTGQSWTTTTKTLGLSLNNDSEELFLWQPDGQLADTVSYAKAPLNIAYQHFSTGWQWADQIISSTTTKTTTDTILDKPSETTQTTSTTTIQSIQGIITALPYQLSSQYLYITYPDNSAGLKIYCYYKLWPQLALGNLIEASGQLVSTTQEIKLNIKNQQDIKILATTTPLTAKTITTQDINQLTPGQLITFTGELAAKNQSTLYLTDDFGELLVQLKTGTGLKNSDFTLGRIYQITGLALNNNGYRLVPRQPEDIVEINLPASSLVTTTLDFTSTKKSVRSPLVWLTGLIISLTLTLLAYRLTKKTNK